MKFFPKKIDDFYTKVGFSGFFELPTHPKKKPGGWVGSGCQPCWWITYFIEGPPGTDGERGPPGQPGPRGFQVSFKI